MRHLLPCAIIAITSARLAGAAPILYTDRTAFEAAVASTHTITFDERVSCESNVVRGRTPSTDLFCTFDDLLELEGDHSGVAFAQTGGALRLGQYSEGFDDFLALRPFMAYGFDLMPMVPFYVGVPPPSPSPIARVALFGASEHLIATPSFFGVVFSEWQPAGTDLLQLMSVPGVGFSRVVVDNVSIAPVPEPTTVLLLIMSLSFLALVRRT
jgi:hypothetical protein